MSRSAWVRAQAAHVLTAVLEHGRSLDLALDAIGELNVQERGLLASLSYDSVRWYVRLEAVLRLLLAHPTKKLAPEIRALGIVGLCQLLHSGIPVHAAVAETVSAARVLGQPRAAGLINALLRRCLREREALLAQVDQDPAAHAAHPRWLYDALQADWRERAPQVFDANNQRPPFWIRVNVRQASGEQYRRRLDEAGIAVTTALFNDEALCLASALEVGDLPGFTSGAVSIQDAAAQLAARLLSVRPGDRVLDACAAPGGKTCHILELQPELDQLVAVDVSAERMTRVADNLRRLGLRATLQVADVSEIERWWDGRAFQRILLDVPCSATGVIRRHPDIKLLRRPEDPPALAERQLRLLQAVWRALAPGGLLVYASCSALRVETTAVVETFLAGEPTAQDVTAAACRGIGLPVATEVGLRIAAGTANMDGFYYACLQKAHGC